MLIADAKLAKLTSSAEYLNLPPTCVCSCLQPTWDEQCPFHMPFTTFHLITALRRRAGFASLGTTGSLCWQVAWCDLEAHAHGRRLLSELQILRDLVDVLQQAYLLTSILGCTRRAPHERKCARPKVTAGCFCRISQKCCDGTTSKAPSCLPLQSHASQLGKSDVRCPCQCCHDQAETLATQVVPSEVFAPSNNQMLPQVCPQSLLQRRL